MSSTALRLTPVLHDVRESLESVLMPGEEVIRIIKEDDIELNWKPKIRLQTVVLCPTY